MSDADLRQRLTPEQYDVCRRGGTESPGTGRYLDHWESGTYRCVACGEPLFASDHKYESNSGWPAFAAAESGLEVDGGRVASGAEVHCRRCGSHMGHVFSESSSPSGWRY